MNLKQLSLDKSNSSKGQITEVAIYKYYPFRVFLLLLLFSVFMGILSWLIENCCRLTKKYSHFSLEGAIIGGFFAGFVLFFPGYLSAFLMDLFKKPVIKFNQHGFYYAPQLWSRNRFYSWNDITNITTSKLPNKENKLAIKVYLIDKRCIAIDETILPIDHHQLLKIFKYCLKKTRNSRRNRSIGTTK